MSSSLNWSLRRTAVERYVGAEIADIINHWSAAGQRCSSDLLLAAATTDCRLASVFRCNHMPVWPLLAGSACAVLGLAADADIRARLVVFFPTPLFIKSSGDFARREVSRAATLPVFWRDRWIRMCICWGVEQSRRRDWRCMMGLKAGGEVLEFEC